VRAYAEKALKLNPLLAEAHLSMAMILAFAEWNFANATNEFQQALKLNPNLAVAHDGYGEYLSALGRFSEGVAENKKAFDLDPLSPMVAADLADAHYYARDFKNAIELAKQAIELDPAYPGSYGVLGWSLLKQGRPEKAITSFKKLRDLFEFPTTLRDLGCAYAAAGDKARAKAALKEMEDIAAKQFV
jgi:tetratricopeptide (TPR) repeat protein